MTRPWIYDLMYRTWAPWDRVGVRQDLVDLLDSGRVDPNRYPRAVDLGCGTGANVVHLAERGFDAWGIDFSKAAIARAHRRAARSGVEPRFVVGDLTRLPDDSVPGPFDLLIDFGTLDDLSRQHRALMAAAVDGLSRPGSVFLEYCFFGERDDLPWFGRTASKLSHVAPGELESLFAPRWDVEEFASYPEWRTVVFLLTRV